LDAPKTVMHPISGARMGVKPASSDRIGRKGPVRGVWLERRGVVDSLNPTP